MFLGPSPSLRRPLSGFIKGRKCEAAGVQGAPPRSLAALHSNCKRLDVAALPVGCQRGALSSSVSARRKMPRLQGLAAKWQICCLSFAALFGSEVRTWSHEQKTELKDIEKRRRSKTNPAAAGVEGGLATLAHMALCFGALWRVLKGVFSLEPQMEMKV